MYDDYQDQPSPCDFCCILNCLNISKCGVIHGDEEAVDKFNYYAEKYNGIKIFKSPKILCYLEYLDTGEKGWDIIEIPWLPLILNNKHQETINY